MKARYHAPPPGSHSGVADYAETLRRALALYEVPEIEIYHIGNNRLHESIYEQALDRPGAVILHDAVLHHLLLGTLSREKYIEEFVFNYGEWRRHLAEELWSDRASSGIDPRYFQFPMLRRLMERSRGVIVHNPGAAALARAHGASKVQVIPHFFEFEARPDEGETLAFRNEISPGGVLFGIFGYLRETKRVLPCIHAFRRVRALRPAARLLLAGEAVSPDLARLLETETSHPGVVRKGYMNDSDFLVGAAAVDCCLNLRYPGAGETSGIAIRMMGLGKPVVVTDSEENGSIPTSACLRVSPGVAEPEELFHHMVLVSEFPQIGRDIGAAARRHIREHHTLDAVARQYRSVLWSL